MTKVLHGPILKPITYWERPGLKRIAFCLLLLFAIASVNTLEAQTRTVTINTAGAYTWTAPCDVTSVTVQAWGAGGGGGYGRSASGAAGGGGGGGAYVTSILTVTPGLTYSIVVGGGGLGGINNGSPSENGGNSSFNSNTIVAAGGSAGNGSSSNGAAAPGIGGTVNASTGTTRYAGGFGATGIAGTGGTAGGGGGGGSAGTAVAGNFTTATVSLAGAAAVAGGGGGGNGTSGGDGSDGNFPGGGGGGGHRLGGGNQTGGNGADGKIIITFNSAFNAYCTSVPNNTGLNDGISRVVFNTIDNSSTTNAGTEYTNYGCTLNTDVERGLSYSLNVYINTGGNNTRTQRAWIDWNQDGDFDDAGESFSLATLTNVTNGLTTVTIPVPVTATLGTTKMRVISSSTTNPNSCDNLNFSGEVEDYKITVTVPTNCTGTPTAGTITISAATGAPGSTFTLTATGYTIGTGISYQWQIANAAAGPWANIAGATTVPSQVITAVGTASTVRYYRLLVTCTPSSGTANSNDVTFTTTSTTAYNIPVSGTTTIPCGTNALLYDNSGPSTNYTGNVNGFFVLQNSGSSVITITGTYNIHSSDFLYIYNGTGTYTNVHQTWYSTTTPTNNSYNGTGTVNFTSAPGQTITIRFQSSNSNHGVGFALNVSYSGSCAASTYCVAPNMGISGYRYYFTSVSFAGSLNDVTNNSTYSNNGYQDFTSLPQAAQEAGEGINVKYTVNTYRGQIKAWVDWNKNNVFDEPSETVYDPSGTLTNSGTFGFTIPSGTAPGNYRLRIRTVNNVDYSNSAYGAAYVTIAPCNRLINGETEDYLFTVVPRCNARVVSVTGTYKCSNTATTLALSVTGTTGVTGFNWYSSESGGTPLAGSTFLGGAPPAGSFTTPAISSTTTYWVAAVDGSCETPVRVPVVAEIRSVPDISFLPGTPSLCEGAAISVAGGTSTPETLNLINEGFEGGGLGVFTVSTPTASPSAANMQWQNKTSAYVPANTTVWRPAISSGFGTNKFLFATSDLANGVLDTRLISPAVNTTSFTSLTLSFKVYYSHYLDDENDAVDDYFDILTSTDGVTYNLLPAHSTSGDNWHIDLGEGTSFATLTYDMSAFAGNPNFRIAFSYIGDWADGIAIDSIRFFGTRPTTSNFTWQQLDATTLAPVLPIDNLYTSLAPATLYVSGNTAANIYVQPTPAQQAAGDPLPFVASLNLTNGCTIKDTIKVYIDSKVWLGNTSNWNLTSNWCGNVLPTLNDRVRIPALPSGGNMPIIQNGNTGSVRSLTIDPGADMTVNAGGTLQVKLDLATQAGGTFTNNGTLKLVGDEAGVTQNFPGSGTIVAMNRLEINNTGAGVALNKNIFIENELKPTAGILALGNYDITIRSNATQTARVSIVGATAGFTYGTGRFEIQRYLTSVKAWRFLATPVDIATSPTITSSWREGGSLVSTGYGTQITGPSGSTGMDETTPGYSMKWYNMNSNDYSVVSNTNSPVANKPGYMVYVRGDRAVNTAGTTTATNLRIKGQLRTGNQSFTVNGNSFQSIGNPYASAISIPSLLSAHSNLAGAYYAWDPSLNGSYGVGGYQTLSSLDGFEAVVSGSALYPVGSLHPDVQSGQAFFIRNFSGTVINGFITEAMKVSGSDLVSREETPADRQFIRTKLFTSTNTVADGNMVAFDDELSNAIDGDDALKFSNSGENFSISRSGKKLSVEARARLLAADTIQYNMSNLREQSYRIMIAPKNTSSAPVQAYFVDKFLRTETAISLTDTSWINITVSAAAASKAADRFMLVFKPSVVLPVTITSVSAGRNADRSIAVKWTVENEVNIVRYEVQRSADGSQFTGILQADAANSHTYTKNDLSPLSGDNFYRIKATSLDGQVQYSNIVKVAPLKAMPSISVYPNPVTDKKMSIRFTGQQKGIYGIQLFAGNGQLVYSGSVNIQDDNSVQDINLGHKVSAGSYLLKITAGTEQVSGQNILIQ